METVGSLVDKLTTIDMKLFYTQEKLYDIRRGTFEDFVTKYNSEEGMKSLYDYFVKVSDENFQRSNFIDEIDQKIVEMINVALTGANLEDAGFIQRKHKTL